MKTTIRLIAFVLLLAGLSAPAANAQNDHKNMIKVGFNSAQLINDGNNLFDDRNSSIYVGYIREKKFFPLLHFVTGVEYFENGSRMDDNNFVKLGYIAAPLGIKGKLGPFSLSMGTSLAIRIHSDFKSEFFDDSTNEFRLFDGSFYAGAGFKFLFFGVDFRHNWGYTDVDRGYNNHFWQLTGSLYF